MSTAFKWVMAVLILVTLGFSAYANHYQYRYWVWLQDAPVYLHKDPRSGDVYLQLPYTKSQYHFFAVCPPESDKF